MVLFRNIHIEKLILSKFIVELEEKQKSKNNKQATFNECADRHLEMCKKKTLEDDEEYIDALKPYIGEMIMGDICIRPQQTNF